MDRPTVGVVMAGGTGTRLYPASRADRPKQLLELGGDRSLLVRAVERAAFADRRVVLTAPRHAERTREHLRAAGFDPGDSGDPAVWVEPEPKDTGPALVYAAWRAQRTVRAPVLVCLPSDHHVGEGFDAVARRAARIAVETRSPVCVGVAPDRPATGYGYVRPGREQDGYAPVEAFHEKPDRERARELIDRGALWNAGMFAWTPTALFGAARGGPLDPLVAAAGDGDRSRSEREAIDGDGDDDRRRGDEGDGEGGDERAIREAFAAVPSVSVDRAVMERAGDAAVVPADLEWDDLGTWDAVARVLGVDGAGGEVATLGDRDTTTVDAEDCLLVAGDAHVTAVGCRNLVVAAVDDRVLVVPTDEAELVRTAVDRLRERDLF